MGMTEYENISLLSLFLKSMFTMSTWEVSGESWLHDFNRKEINPLGLPSLKSVFPWL